MSMCSKRRNHYWMLVAVWVLYLGVGRTGAVSVANAQSPVRPEADSAEDSGFDKAAIQAAAADLASTKFQQRQSAFETLILAGDAAIEVLQVNAIASEDLETGTRCIEALIQIAENEKSRLSVLAAMKKVAADAIPTISGLAAQRLELLSLTKEQRAVQTLESYGERVYRRGDSPITLVRITKDKSAHQLRHFPKLRMLTLAGPGVTDDALPQLPHLTSLKTISIEGASITDRGLRQLSTCRSLQRMSLSDRAINGSLVSALSTLP